ncbi:MAG TPA: carboxypeptidase regulatory-like domain-containing protein, partial [Vicinamibacterales bacterium]
MPTLARAQSTNAIVTGTIVDANGGVLPGVTVTATNTQTGLVRAVVTGERGAFQLNALPPGSYKVIATLEGFAPQAKPPIVLAIGQVTTLNFTLGLASVKESVTVTGAAPVVDTSTSQISSAVTPQEVDQLPLVGRQFMDLATLAPGVSIDNTSANAGSDNVAFAGFGEADKAEFLEGMDINDGDTRGGTGLSQAARHDFTQETVQEFQVLATGYSVEFGRSDTGVLNILTKSGTNSFHGRGYYFLRDHSFQKPNAFASGNPPFRQQQSGGTLGGPIRQNKAWFFLTYENDYENSSVAVTVPAFVLPIITDPRTNVPTPVRKNNVFGKYTMSLSPTQYLNVIGLFNRETLNNQDLGGTTAGDSGDNKIYHDELLNLSLTSTFSNTITNELKGGISDAWKIRPPNGPLTPEVDFPSITYGTHTNFPQNRDQKNFTLTDTLHLHKETRWGTHDFKFGGTANYVKLWNYHESAGHGQFTFLTDQLPVPGDPSTYPVSFLIRTFPSCCEYFNPSSYDAFAEDAWRPRSNITVTVGFRWDGMRWYDKGYTAPEADGSTAAFLVNFLNGTLPNAYNYKPFNNTNDYSPRISVAWDPNNDGRTVVRGAYGYYYGYTGDNTANGAVDSYPGGATVTYANDVRVTGIPNTFFPNIPDLSTLQVSAGSASVSVPTPGAWHDPLTQQASFGLDRQIGPSTSISVDYIHIRGLYFPMRYNIIAK